MEFNYEQFKNLPQKELEKIGEYIRNLIAQREHKILDAIAYRNVEKLKEALSYNDEKKLSKQAWNLINFYDLKEKDIEFFEYVRKLPEYKKNDVDLSQLTRTQTALNSALFNEKIFDYFIKQEDLLNDFKVVVSKQALDQRVPMPIIDKLFKNKLLVPSQKILKEIFDKYLPNYFEYLLKNDLMEISKEEFKTIYMQNWNGKNKDLLSLVRTAFPEYKEIPLNELICQFSKTYYGKNFTPDRKFFQDHYKSFVEMQEERFLSLVSEHGVQKDEVKSIVAAFNQLSPLQDVKFHKFVHLIVADYPEAASKLKKYRSFIKEHFKSEYEKAINYIDITLNLENTDNVQVKKMKI